MTEPPKPAPKPPPQEQMICEACGSSELVRVQACYRCTRCKWKSACCDW